MLTGKHKIGNDGVSVVFHDNGDVSISCKVGGETWQISIGEDGAKELRDLLNAHFGEWVPCGPDGPFPAGDAEDNYDVTFECKFENHTRRYVSVATLASIPWNAKQENWRVVAWKPRVKPYKPEGNAK